MQRSKLEADAAEAAAEHSRQLAAELDAFNKLPPLEQSAAWAHKLMGEVCWATYMQERPRACMQTRRRPHVHANTTAARVHVYTWIMAMWRRAQSWQSRCVKDERCYVDEQGCMVLEEVWVEKKTDDARPFASALENGCFDASLGAGALTDAAFSKVTPAPILLNTSRTGKPRALQRNLKDTRILKPKQKRNPLVMHRTLHQG